MPVRFNELFQGSDNWFTGHCPEVPGANGEGRTLKECQASLAEAISLIFEDQGATLDPKAIIFDPDDD